MNKEIKKIKRDTKKKSDSKQIELDLAVETKQITIDNKIVTQMTLF